MPYEIIGIVLTFALYFIIFSPLIFSRKSKDTSEFKGWRGIFQSKWFGIPFIFLLLFGNYSFDLAIVIVLAIVLPSIISLIANWKLLVKG